MSYLSISVPFYLLTSVVLKITLKIAFSNSHTRKNDSDVSN